MGPPAGPEHLTWPAPKKKEAAYTFRCRRLKSREETPQEGLHLVYWIR